MGALDKLKSRMSGPGKTPFGRPTEPVSEQVNNNVSIDQTKKNIASAGQFIAQEGAGQALKKFAGNVASKAFGVAGMLLSSQKAYAGGNKTDEEWEKIQNPETVNFKNPNTGEIKSVRAADADAFSNVPDFKGYVRQDG